MVERLQLVLLIPALAFCGSALSDPGDPRVVVVATDFADLATVFGSLRLRPQLVPKVSRVPDRSQAVLVLADSYPEPRALSVEEINRLEALAAGGARLYLEFGRPHQRASCFGVQFADKPLRAIHERLVVLRKLGALEPEGLLEEHEGAYVPFVRVPQNSEVLLEYDLALGTYSRVPWPEQGVFTVTVDLGESHALSSASQRYGAGQPNYYPESVELWLSADGSQLLRAGRVEGTPVTETVRFSLKGQRARYVRFVARKFRRSPVTDFLFMGEIEVRDERGTNLALHAPYVLESPHPQSGPYCDNGRKLTDGLIEGLYTDKLSVGWGTPASPQPRNFPAMVKVPWGRGEVILSAPRLSDFRRRNFRLTRRWEELWRGVVLSLLPPGGRDAIAARYVPLEAYTEPRLWAPPRTPVKLVVKTRPGAEVRATSERLGELALSATQELTRERATVEPDGPQPGGRFEATFVAERGSDKITVTAKTATGTAATEVSFDCKPRREKYREALDLNMKWFTQSGVLPKPDGSGGIHSQVCMAWLESHPPDYDFLGSPFRVDCNAMSFEAFYLYGLLTGNERHKRISRNLANTVVAHQYTDEGRASLGGFPWLYENNDTLFFWDDNCRISNALLWLYHWTREAKYLRSALLSAELFRQIARDDTCVHRHAINRGELDKIGREAYREFSQGSDGDFRLTHWWTLAAVTGDAIYRELAEECTRLWGRQASLLGAPYAAYYAGDASLKQRLKEQAEAFLRNEEVRKHGMTTVGGGGYELAFTGDCGIATRDGEPLTDQIYATPWQFLSALRAWRATGDETCRRMCETVGDYMVRIQCHHPDKRLDGCWMRGFDVQHWEYYGAPYDPAYGPYSAYTGWMNAIAAQAFARYLLEEDPFVPVGKHPEAAAILSQVRAVNPKLISSGANVALNCPYRLSNPGSGVYADDGKKLTDGMIDGPYEDHLSVGWGIPTSGQSLHITMDLDLKKGQRLKLITQQYGAGRGSYNPDEVRVSASEDGFKFKEVRQRQFGKDGAGLLWLVLEEPVTARHLRFELEKQRRSPTTDFLFVGETKAFAAP